MTAPATKFTSNPANTAEATTIMGYLNGVCQKNPELIPGVDREFLADMRGKMNSYGSGLVVGNKQIERLRAIKRTLDGV